MRTALTHSWHLIRCAGAHWVADSAGTLGAALAFYSPFSLAPLLVILVTVAGFFIGNEAAYGQVGSQLDALFGSATARVLLQAMQSSQQDEGTLATVVSSITLLIGATTVFAALEDALERIWRAKALVPPGVRGWLRSRLLARSTTPSAFGAAASFAALLLWLYYTAQIFLFSAEFTACLGGLRKEKPAQS